jgi:hypothetical protein
MHLVPGLAATSEGGVVQATRSLCAPYLGYVPFEPKVGAPMSKGRATSCMSFNNEVLDYLRATPSIEVVVLSNSLGAYADKHTGWKALQRRAGGIRETTARVSDADAAARATIDALREMGIKVVVIAPLPTAEFDVALCRERRQTGRLLLGPHASCRIEVTEYRRVTSAQREFLSRLAAAAGVSVIGFDAFLCDASQCATELGGKPLYRDADHMTREGSELLGKMMGLGGLVEREAR